MAYLFIYLIQLSTIMAALIGLCSMGSVLAGVIYVMSRVEKLYTVEPIAKNAFIVFTALLIISVLFPSKQTLLLSGATYYGTKVYKNIVTDEKVSKVNTIINLELDKQIKNLREEIK